MEKIKYIEFTKIEKIEVYENKNKKTVKEIVKETGCNYAITGNFYNTSWKPTCHLKKDGEVLATSPDVYRGFAWNTAQDFKQVRVPTESGKYKNHYACCCLVANGNAYPDDLVFYNKDVGGVRGRTAIGIKGKCLVLYASTDGSSNAKTPEKLRDYMYAKGVQELIMGDGGGKVNFYGDGEYIVGKEKSQNLILVYLKKETAPEQNKPTTVDKVGKIVSSILKKNPRQIAHAYKKKIGYMQHSTGTPGAKASGFLSTWNQSNCQAETEFIIDDTGIYQCLDLNIRTWHCGGSGNNTHVGAEICEPIEARVLEANWQNLSMNGKNNTNYAVTLLQKELDARGYSVNGIDGIFGSGLKAAVVKFQKDNGLSADGIVGKGTLRKLQDREGSYLKYDKKGAQSYFENVYDKAVYTCAYVLNSLGVSTITRYNVLGHHEGYQQNIASNHADPEHWFKQHDKTMDDFRADVKEYMYSGKLPFENKIELTPWGKACKMGLFEKEKPDATVTQAELAFALDKLNLLNC